MTPLFDNEDMADRLMLECRRWLGTPAAHCGYSAGSSNATCGIAGDCVHTVVRIYENIGAIATVEIPAYDRLNCMMAEEDDAVTLAKFLEGLVTGGSLSKIMGVGNIHLGDVLTFRYAQRLHHLGIATGNAAGEFYHMGGKCWELSTLRGGQHGPALRNIYRMLR